MNNLQIIEVKGQRVLTTKQIAEAYGAEELRIRQNYKANKRRYEEGKHFIFLTGQDLQALKRAVGNCYSPKKHSPISKFTSAAMFWTEKGALLHAKSLNTDKAWEVYDWLVDFYFKAREKVQVPPVSTVPAPQVKKQKEMVLDMPGNEKVQEQTKQLRDYCTSIMVLLELQNRYLAEEKVKAIHESIKAIGAYIFMGVTELSDIKVKEIEAPK